MVNDTRTYDILIETAVEAGSAASAATVGVARARVAPSRVWRPKVEARIRREAGSITTPGLGAVGLVGVGLVVPLVIDELLVLAVALGVLMSRPIPRHEDPVASLATSLLAELLLSPMVGVGEHAGREGEKLCATHDC